MQASAKYPRPDRSGIARNFTKTPDDDAIDLGWQEGVLSDGRPFLAEFWCQDQISILTFFLSRIGLDNASDAELAQLLVREGLVWFKTGKDPHVKAMRFSDSAGNDVWSVNVTVGNEDETFVAGSLPIQPYARK